MQNNYKKKTKSFSKKELNKELDPFSLVKFLLEIMLLCPASGLLYQKETLKSNGMINGTVDCCDLEELYKKLVVGYYSQPYNCIDVETFEKDVIDMFDSLSNFGIDIAEETLSDKYTIFNQNDINESSYRQPRKFRFSKQLNLLKNIFESHWSKIKDLCLSYEKEMIKKFKVAFGKNDESPSTTDELDLFDFVYTPGDIVNTSFGDGTIVRADNSFEKLAIELNEWILNGNEKVMIFCNPLEVSLIRTSLQNNSDSILPPQSLFQQRKVNICSKLSSSQDELYGKDVILQNTYGVDLRFVGYIGKVVDIGKDKRWRRVQLYPLAYKIKGQIGVL